MRCLSRFSLLVGIAIALIFANLPSAKLAAASRDKADAVAGAILFRDKGCVRCHGADLKGTLKAPALAGIQNDRSWPPEKITRQILNGGQKMPPFADALTDPQIAQIVAYLRARHRPAPPAAPPTN